MLAAGDDNLNGYCAHDRHLIFKRIVLVFSARLNTKMRSDTHIIDVEHVDRVHRDPNVAYAGRPIRNAVWFTGGPREDYVVSSDEMEKYEYAVLHDPKNTKLPRPLSFGVVAVLSPHSNFLVPDTTITSDDGSDLSLGEGSGVFVNHEDGSQTQWHEAWETLLDIAGRILPLSVEPTSASGLFRVVHYDQPALSLKHSFFRVIRLFWYLKLSLTCFFRRSRRGTARVTWMRWEVPVLARRSH